MSEKDFKFHLPIDLVKSEEEGELDSWKIRGVASTPDVDLQGETVDQEGLDISLLKAGRGLFNADHQKGPENVLGQIEDAEFVTQDGKKVLMVQGYLFKHQERAKAFYNIMKSLKKGSSQRVQMSIEGKIIQRDFVNNKAIKKARIDKVALCLDPVNPHTYAELCKSLNSPDPIDSAPAETVEMVSIKKSELEVLLNFVNKAMSAGTGSLKAPEARSGGEAMTCESLEGSPKNMSYPEQKPKRKKDKKGVRSMMKSLQEAYPDRDPLEIAEMVIENLVDRIDE